MFWDNVLGLTLLPGRFRILSDQKICEEKNGREKQKSKARFLEPNQDNKAGR
jgi:hypothetical protein